MNKVVLPESFLKCVSPEDRKKLKLVMTAQEFMAAGAAKNERDLQKQIVSLLRLKGIEVNVSRMDKRKTDRVGWPDLTFSIYALAPKHISDRLLTFWQKFPCAWEVKCSAGKLSREQEQMAIKLQSEPNCWRYRVIRSVDEAIKELAEMGIT